MCLLLPESRSLKSKRSVVRSVVDRTRSRFRVAVAEVDDLDLDHRAVLGVSALGNSAGHVNAVLDRVRDAVASQVAGRAELVDVQLEMLNVSFKHL